MLHFVRLSKGDFVPYRGPKKEETWERAIIGGR